MFLIKCITCWNKWFQQKKNKLKLFHCKWHDSSLCPWKTFATKISGFFFPVYCWNRTANISRWENNYEKNYLKFLSKVFRLKSLLCLLMMVCKFVFRHLMKPFFIILFDSSLIKNIIELSLVTRETKITQVYAIIRNYPDFFFVDSV